MYKRLILFLILIVLYPAYSLGQVKVRLFSDKAPESALFSVTEGKYELNVFSGDTLIVTKGEPVIISRFNGKLAVKVRNAEGFVCDSVKLAGKTGYDSFSLRINGNAPIRQFYSGDLKCFPDLGTIVLINNIDIERYIAGVVKAEGGSGKNIEYFKTQAFNGLSSDTLINRAALETQGLVILDQDSTLIISAFHSNCGGETSSSEDVWLISLSYLKSVVDPYCISSRNAVWGKSFSLKDWFEFIKKSGYNGSTDDPATLSFIQKSRSVNYKTGSFTMPLRTIRTDMNLRSTFFSVVSEGDSVILKGKGYGHGVGLCQEGAMVMAANGFNFRQIIDFYYFGVLITDIKNAVILPPN